MFQLEISLLQLFLLSFDKINQDVPIQWIPNLPVTPFKYRLSLDPPITMHSCNAFTSPFHALLKHEVVWLLCIAQPKNTICLILHRDIALKHTPLSQHLLNQIFLIEPQIHTFLVFFVWWKSKGEGGMLLAPMLTLSDVSKGGWDTCARGANTSCLQLPTYATKRNSSSGCYLYGSALLTTWGCSHCSCSQRSDFGKLRLWERQLPTISQLSSE